MTLINWNCLPRKEGENTDEAFIRLYHDVGVGEIAHSLGCHRHSVTSRYHFLTKYKAGLPNGRVVPKEKQFPYSSYLKILLAEIRKHAEANRIIPPQRNNALFMVWLRSKAGQRILTCFAKSVERGTDRKGYEFGEG